MNTKHRSYAVEIVKKLPGASLLLDENRQILVANAAFLKMFQIDEADLQHGDANQIISEKIWSSDQFGQGDEFIPLSIRLPKARDVKTLVNLAVLEDETYSSPQYLLSFKAPDVQKHKESEIIRAAKEKPIYRLMASNLPGMGILVFDCDFRYLMAEGPALREVGYNREEVEGRTIYEVLGEEAIDQLIPFYKKTLMGETAQFEYHVPRFDKYYSVKFLPVLTDEGDVAAGMIVNQDITVQKKSVMAMAEREAQLHSIVKNFPSGIILLFDKELRYLLVDGLGLENINRDPEAMIGKTIYEVYPEEIVKNIEPYYLGALNGESSEVQIPVNQKMFLQRAYPVKNEAGEIIAGVILSQDVTEMERMSELLHNTSRTAKVGGWEIDIETKTPLWTDEVYRIHEVEIGMDTTLLEAINFFHPDDRPKIQHAVDGLIGQGKPYDLELKFITAKNNSRWVRAIGKADMVDGAPARLYGIFQDITERKTAELAITDLNRTLAERAIHLQALNSELEAFAYSVSHDLRAPLRSIDGFSLALLEDYHDLLDEEGQDFLNRVRAATQRMSTLIDDMLTLSRISRMEVNKRETNLSKIVQDIAERLTQDEPERDVELVIQPNVVVHCDVNLMEIALNNLIENAWKFTRLSSNPRIEFGQRTENGVKELFISDNGAGFDMQYVDKLFGAFQRLHSPKKYPGTGIGLATVQRIIFKHGGKIRGIGEEGQGATFFIQM